MPELQEQMIRNFWQIVKGAKKVGGGVAKQGSLRQGQNRASSAYGEKGTQIDPVPWRSQRQHK